MTQKKSKASPRAAMARAWGTLGWLWLAAAGEINVSLPWAARARVVWSDEAGWVVFELDG